VPVVQGLRGVAVVNCESCHGAFNAHRVIIYLLAFSSEEVQETLMKDFRDLHLWECPHPLTLAMSGAT
jgi:hypothetical protein